MNEDIVCCVSSCCVCDEHDGEDMYQYMYAVILTSNTSAKICTEEVVMVVRHRSWLRIL
jgi:hypothetical protein